MKCDYFMAIVISYTKDHNVIGVTAILITYQTVKSLVLLK